MEKNTRRTPEIVPTTAVRSSASGPSNIDVVASQLARLIGRQMAREHFQLQHRARTDKGDGRE
jgi:hypothetical protein